MTSPLESTSIIFAKAARRPDKERRYIKIENDSVDIIGKNEKSRLKDVFQGAQAEIKQALIEFKRGERRELRDDLLSIIDSTEQLQDRYRKRAGNILVRLGLFTPREKRETLKSAENLVETAQAAIHLLNQLKSTALELSDEEYLKLEGNDPNYLLSLLEQAGPEGVYRKQKEQLETLATDQCIELFELFVSNLERPRDIVFENGHWVSKKLGRNDTMNSRNDRLNAQLLNYMSHINYQTLSEMERFQDRPGFSPRDFLRGSLNRVATPLQLIQCLGAKSVDQPALEVSFAACPPEWIPVFTKYLRDFELEEIHYIHVLEHAGSLRGAQGLIRSLRLVLGSGWRAPVEHLSNVYSSGLLDNREFRHSHEILSQLKRLHLPENADFDQRVKRFALKTHENDAAAASNLYNDLTALKLYCDRTNEDVPDRSMALLLNARVRSAFRNDFAKLLSFANDRLPPDADEETWKEFIVWKNAKPTDLSGRGLKTLLNLWSRFEEELRKETMTWDNAADSINFTLLFSLNKTGAWSHLLQDPLVMEFFEKKLPNLNALVHNEMPERVILGYRWYAFLARRFESGEVTTREQAIDLIQELKWLKGQYRALIDGSFSSSDLQHFEALLYTYTTDQDFTDLFFEEFPNLFKLIAQDLPESANLQMRALSFVLAMRRKGKLKDIEVAKNCLSCIPHLELFQKALQDGEFDYQDFKWLTFFGDAFTNAEFRRLFPTQFPFLESLLKPETVAIVRPQVAGLCRFNQADKRKEITLESAEQLYKDLLALDAKEEDVEFRIKLYERWIACKGAHTELFSQLAEQFPVLNAIVGDPLLAPEPEMKAFLTVFKAYKNGEISSINAIKDEYEILCVLLKLERKDSLSIEEQKMVAETLHCFILGHTLQSVSGLSSLIPQAFYHKVPHEDDPYFVSVIHYLLGRFKQDPKCILTREILFNFQALDALFPIIDADSVSKLAFIAKSNICDEQTLEFVRSKFPYTASAIEVMRRNPLLDEPEEMTAEGVLFWGMQNSKIFEEENHYRHQHCRQGITVPYTNLAFGDCTLKIGEKERKVASWFVRTALPESAYAIEAGKLKFTGDWSEEELSWIVEYCYTGKWVSDVLQLSFAKKAKEQGLEALYRAICADMIVNLNPKSAAALYPEAHKEGLSHLAQGLLKTAKRRVDLGDLSEEERVVRLALMKTFHDNGEPHADWTVAPLPSLNSLADLRLVKDYTLIGSDGEVRCNKGILALSSELLSRAKVEMAKNQATFEELDSEALLLAVQFAETQQLPQELPEELVAKLWDAADVLEMTKLKELLLAEYDLKLYVHSKSAILNIQSWRDVGIEIDEAREARAWNSLRSLEVFNRETQNLLWIPGGLSQEEVKGFISALIEANDLKVHLLELSRDFGDTDKWVVLDTRRGVFGEGPLPLMNSWVRFINS
ncbi:MAG: BTB/POZ domain-containing protein [Parachlamydiaceae bacterium]